MPKATSLPVDNWVKNVYSLWFDRVVACVSPSPSPTKNHLPPTTPVHNSHQYTHFLTTFTPASYTAFFTHFNLLYTRLYTLSTVPINTKKR